MDYKPFKQELSPFYSQKINKNRILEFSVTENKSLVRFLCRSVSGKYFWGPASLCTAKIISETILKIRSRSGRETDGQDFQRLLNGAWARTCIKSRLLIKKYRSYTAVTGDNTATPP